jgi:hypothetical protein
MTYEDNEIRTKLTLRTKQTKIGVAKVAPFTSNDHLNDMELFIKYQDSAISLQGKPATLTDYKRQNTKYPFIVKMGKGSYKVSRTQLLKAI